MARADVDLRLVHAQPAAGDACPRALRALRALVEARLRPRAPGDGTHGRGGGAGGRGPAEEGGCQEEARALQDALLTTAFGQSLGSGLISRLLLAADFASLPGDVHVELRGSGDALYVVLAGAAEVVRGPSAKARILAITVHCARGLQGDTEVDSLDPYVVVQVGSKQYRSPVATDAGADPDFNWTVHVRYSGEPEIEFTVMEHDSYSRHDVLAAAAIDQCQFEREQGFEGELSLGEPLADNERTGSKEPVAGRKVARAAGGAAGGAVTLDSAGMLKVTLAWVSESQALLGSSLGTEAAKLMDPAASSGGPGTGAGGGGGGAGLASTAPPVAGGASSASGLLAGAAAAAAGGRASGNFARAGASAGPASFAAAGGRPGARLGPGHFFGLGDGGGALRTLEPCQLLLVPRAVVSEASRAYRAECKEDRESFLRRHMPGAQALDSRPFEHFASAFRQLVLPSRHTICKAGDMGAGENRCVYIIRRGTCRAAVPRPPAGVAASPAPPKRSDESARAPAAAAPMGLLGEGAVLCYASALFGVPEPFTAETTVPVSVLCISLAERSVPTWPREVVNRLHELLRAKTEWHSRRVHNLAASPTVNKLFHSEEDQWKPPEWRVSDSRFWCNKDLSAWRSETIRDLYDAQGWKPPPSVDISAAAACGGVAAAPPAAASGAVGGAAGGAASAAGRGGGGVGGGAGGGGGRRPLPLAEAVAPALAHAASPASAASPSRLAKVASAPALARTSPSPEVGGLGLARPAEAGAAARPGSLSSPSAAASAAASVSASPSPRAHGVRPTATASAAHFVAAAAAGGESPVLGFGTPPADGRGSYNVNSGIGRCKTPWGTWSPSGMLPPATGSLAGRHQSWQAHARARKRAAVPHGDAFGGGFRGGAPGRGEEEGAAAHDAEGDGGGERPGRAVNLRCPSDWRRLRAVASAGALEKMYRRQVRTTHAAAAGAVCSGDGGRGADSGPATTMT